MSSSRIATTFAATVGIVIAVGVGYGIHASHKKLEEQRAAVSVVSNTTVQLRGALKSPSPEALGNIEGSLKIAKRWSNAELTDATEQYLVGARAIVRRRAEANRLQAKAAASRAELSAHMQRAGRRDTPWIHTASALKRQVERDHFDLEVQLKALAELLELLPEANKRLAPHVRASLLLDDEARRGARKEVLDESRRAYAELEKVRSILPR
jgi:hypothetical protein